MKTETDYMALFIQLRHDIESMPWEERLRLARSIQRQTGNGFLDWEPRQIIELFCQDPRREIRIVAAELIRHLTDEAMQRMHKVLENDTSRYVREAAKRSLEHRRVECRRIEYERDKTNRIRRKLQRLGREIGDQNLRVVQEIVEHERSILVGKLVHDLRGFLTRVDCRSHQMLVKMEGGDYEDLFYEAAEEIQQQVSNMSRLAEDMRELASELVDTIKPRPIGALIEEAKNLAVNRALKRHSLEDLRIVIECDQRWSLPVARHEMLMALSNLIENAIDAVEATEPDKQREIDISVRPISRNHTKYHEIIIRDTGIGISEETLEYLRKRIPGFTSKQPYGTGFGLVIAWQTIDRHGGTMAIESIEDEGTTITIRLPKKRERQ